MSWWLFKDLQILKRIAEGFVKAGLPIEPNDFYKISTDNRLKEDEIKALFFGRKVSGSTLPSNKTWQIERNKDGKATIVDNDKSDTGKSWIEDDMLCKQWDSFYEGL